MLRLLNPRKKYRAHRADDENPNILIRESRYTSIFQRPDGYYDVYGDVPSGQNAFLGTFKGLNGAEKAARDNDRHIDAVIRSGRYNPLRRNPVTVKKSEQGREQFWVNENKWFTSREKAEAWLAAHGEGSVARPTAPAPQPARPAAARPAAARPAVAPPKARVTEVIEISDPQTAAYSFSPTRSNTVMYDGTTFPSLEHAFTGIWKRSAADRKSLKRAHWDRAMDMRLYGNGPFGGRLYVYKMPKGKDIKAEVLEITRDLLRNRQLADLLLATGNKTLSYRPESERILIRRIEDGAIPNKKGTRTDGMFLGGYDQLYANALMQVRDELRSNIFRQF